MIETGPTTRMFIVLHVSPGSQIPLSLSPRFRSDRIAHHQVMGMQGWVLSNAKDNNTVTHRITGTQYNTKQQQFLKEIFQALPFLPPGTSELRTSHLIGAAAFWLSHALVDKMHLYTNGIKGRQHG